MDPENGVSFSEERKMETLGNAGCVRQFARFAREHGIPLGALLDDELRAIVASSEVADRVPAHAIIDLLQICSIGMNRAALGASSVAWAKINGGFGPLSLMWDHAPTLAEATRVNRQYAHLENGAVAFHCLEEGDEIVFQHILMVPARYGGSQFVEASLALDLRIFRKILDDENWSPLRLELTHSSPPNVRVQHGLFRCSMDFGADRNAIVVRRSDLKRPAPNGNVQMFAFLERQIQSAGHDIPDDLPRRVDKIIAARLAEGRATLDHVAREVAMSPRALQRQLADHELAFADLLTDVRKRITHEYFRSEKRPNLTELAHRLGYSDNSAVSRFLRKHLDTGAKALRFHAGHGAGHKFGRSEFALNSLC